MFNQKIWEGFMNTLERYLFYSVRCSSLFSPLAAGFGIYLGGIWTYLGFGLFLGFYMIVELILLAAGVGTDFNSSDIFRNENPKLPSWLANHGLAISGSLMLLVVPPSVFQVASSHLSTFEVWGSVLSLAFVSGSVGGFVGHEYIHRKSKFERLFGTLVYGCFGNGHFAVSHVFGHHQMVGLHEDWNTSRLGESSYRFFVRAIFEGYLASWSLTANNLKRKKQAFWSTHNFMLRLTLVQLVLLIFLFSILPFLLAAKTVGIYLGYSIIALCLSEMVNYLSHYGITRKKNQHGTYEKMESHHSWESANKVTNWFIFDAGKHSEHHLKPTTKHFELKFSYNEKIPFGFVPMTLIALIPPLYFRIMDPLVRRRERILQS